MTGVRVARTSAICNFSGDLATRLRRNQLRALHRTSPTSPLNAGSHLDRRPEPNWIGGFRALRPA